MAAWLDHVRRHMLLVSYARTMYQLDAANMRASCYILQAAALCCTIQPCACAHACFVILHYSAAPARHCDSGRPPVWHQFSNSNFLGLPVSSPSNGDVPFCRGVSSREWLMAMSVPVLLCAFKVWCCSFACTRTLQLLKAAYGMVSSAEVLVAVWFVFYCLCHSPFVLFAAHCITSSIHSFRPNARRVTAHNTVLGIDFGRSSYCTQYLCAVRNVVPLIQWFSAAVCLYGACSFIIRMLILSYTYESAYQAAATSLYEFAISCSNISTYYIL